MSFRRDMIGAERVAEGIASLEEREHEGEPRCALDAGTSSGAERYHAPTLCHRLPGLLQRQGVTGLQ